MSTVFEAVVYCLGNSSIDAGIQVNNNVDGSNEDLSSDENNDCSIVSDGPSG
jgi:hypothetical protein